MKKILVINGHPLNRSLCAEMALSYQKGALSAGAECKLINLSDFNFDPILHYGYQKKTKLEPELISIQQDILDADHLVFVYPTWWGTYPALLKGFIDRVFLPEFAFNYHKNSLRREKLLKNKTARLILTTDTSKFSYFMSCERLGNPMRKNVLKVCGIQPVKVSSFGPVKLAGDFKIKSWLWNVQVLGRKLK